jgi:hypothetical protein
MKDPRHLSPGAWALWRQDDNGHQFLICVKDSRDEAEELRARYEGLGHKQFYFVEPYLLAGADTPD